MQRLVPLLFLGLLSAARLAAAGEVRLSEDKGAFRLTNGVLAATIEKSTARVTAVAFDGQDLLGKGSGYWSMSASSAESEVGDFGRSVSQFISIDPAANSGERAEVVCRFKGSGMNGAYPGTSEIRYGLDRFSNTLYATAILSHDRGDAPFRIGEGRFVMKLDAGIFDQLIVDSDRNRIMPTGRDWDAGTTLNLKEARRLTTGIHAGEVEHKYGYSAMLGEIPAYGWVGTKSPYGVWLINPSVEFIAGGPTKMELTGHLDVGGTALPTLLNMWHGSHYGGTVLTLQRDEKWSKVIGPFAIHFNQGGQPMELLKSAYCQAGIERTAWPYPWLRHEAYLPPDARGGISGRLLIAKTRSAALSEGTLWVGLTVPQYSSKESRTREAITWQRDGKYYQYWTKARPDGSFVLKGVRPGTYVMRAFGNGVLGEFERPDLTIESGTVRSIGEIHWTPEQTGAPLWEIGIPDRSAAEFRNGDRYWEWGNYLKFKTDFPTGVNYLVGKSDWRRDWHICQPLDLSPSGKVLGSSTWKVRFPLPEIPSGGTRLRVAFCGSREGSRLSLLVNGTKFANLTMPENGAMHRDSHRGMWFERAFDIPAKQLRPGENLLEFRLDGTAWHHGVLYDHIQMEIHENH